MIDFPLILTVTVMHILAVVSPGPDFVLTVRNSLQYGRGMGMATAVGLGMGITLHVTYSIAGVAILIQKYPSLFVLIKTLGAAYLIYLGLSALWSLKKAPPKEVIQESSHSGPQSIWGGLRQGFLTNILNPKATLFIFGLFSSVIPFGTSLLTMMIVGFIMVIVTILWFTVVGLLFSTQKVRKGYLKMERGLSGLFALIFIVAGAFILLK